MIRYLSVLLLCAAASTPPDDKRGQGERAADPAAKMICKRFADTGSLVRGSKVCKTKREWEQDRDVLRTPVATGACNRPGGGIC